MTTIPIWVWIVCLAEVAGMLVGFVATVPRDRRPDVAAGLVLRVVLVGVLAVQGAFLQTPDQPVPWLGLVIAIALVLSLSALRSATAADLADLTRVQVFRTVGWLFVALMLLGKLPWQFALPAGLGDIAVGLTAPVIARRLRRGDTRGAIAFHALGILDLVVAIGMGFFSAPGPYQIFTGPVTTAAMTVLPLILIPTVLVPLSIAIHIVAIRRLHAGHPAVGGYPNPALEPAHA
jgi:hypothetical protein